MTASYTRREALQHLTDCCPQLGGFIQDYGPIGIPSDTEKDLFRYLSRAITYQQLSGKAAETIHGRFATLFDNELPEPGQAASMSIEKLRSSGLSGSKARAIQDLAVKTLDGTLASRASLVRRENDAVIENICQVWGIGPWTVQMLLMFNFRRPDVMPATDLGVQKGVQVIYSLSELPSPDEVVARTTHLSPYRSVASLYFWRAADTVVLS
ncbi:MAG TPA: DNA-3-methyladenine glycosylase 2 family protein [Xanthomonadales bacterium]|nr:DNA-3-methyladenine glycosylase 2 family protein [Xanthomonadales bacterium]